MTNADIFTIFRQADLVLLQHQSKHVLLNPDTFRVYKLSAEAAAVLSSIQTGTAPEAACASYGLPFERVTVLLRHILADLERPTKLPARPLTPDRHLKGGRLWKLVMMVNNFCNLQCTYCYEHENVFTQKSRHMSPEVIEETLAQFYRTFSEIENIMFIGGEPTLSEDAVELSCKAALAAAARHEVPAPRLSMVTNGVRLSARMEEVIERFQIHLTFSVDGPPPVQDLIRIHHDKSGSFAAVKRNYEKHRLTASQPPLVEATITRAHHWNKLSVLNLIDFLAKEFHIAEAHVMAAGLKKGDPLNPYVEESPYFVAEVEEAAAATVDRMIRQESAPQNATVGYFDLAKDMVTGILKRDSSATMCPAGTSQLVVDAKGDLYPCWMFSGTQQMAMGNILTDGLENPRADAVLRRIAANNKYTHPECAQCYARHVCHACIGNNQNINGSIEGLDRNHCDTVRTTFRTVLVKITENMAAIRKQQPPAAPTRELTSHAS
jgi:uncharacterized protein